MGLLGHWVFEDLSPGGTVMDEKPLRFAALLQ